jgi:autotransporter-associated beta strand protein
MTGMGGGVAVDEGIANFLPGAAVVAGNVLLAVNNPNTGPGSAVTVNLHTSIYFRTLSGTVATASSGTNTATLNLVGSGTELRMGGASSGSCAAAIAGDGSLVQADGTQILSGNNRYTGTTRVTGGTLLIDGVTSGQGDYLLQPGPTSAGARLGGSGTIGLAANAKVLLSGGFLSPANFATVGTLRV